MGIHLFSHFDSPAIRRCLRFVGPMALCPPVARGLPFRRHYNLQHV